MAPAGLPAARKSDASNVVEVGSIRDRPGQGVEHAAAWGWGGGVGCGGSYGGVRWGGGGGGWVGEGGVD